MRGAYPGGARTPGPRRFVNAGESAGATERTHPGRSGREFLATFPVELGAKNGGQTARPLPQEGENRLPPFCTVITPGCPTRLEANNPRAATAIKRKDRANNMPWFSLSLGERAGVRASTFSELHWQPTRPFTRWFGARPSRPQRADHSTVLGNSRPRGTRNDHWRFWKGACLAMLWLLLLSGLEALAQPKLTASLDRDTISLGESATLSLTVEGAKPSQLPSITAPQNLAIQYLRQSSSWSVINGQASSSIKLDYRVVPASAGEFTIPAIQIVVDKQRLSTQPLALRVLPADTTTPDPNGIGRFAFLKLIVPKTSVFVGEVLPVDVQLYFAVGGEQLQLPQFSSEGFSFGQIFQPPQNKNPPSAQVGNSTYRVVSFKTTATAVKTGSLTLGPVQCSLVLQIPVARRARDPFEDFFDFGPRVQRQAVTLTTEPLNIEVLPLPTANRPSDFSGAVGSFNWTVSASPTNVIPGDPITLKVQLKGEGALDRLSLPSYDWRDFKTYPPNGKTETTDPLGIKGIKTFEQVIVPQNADVREIPALRFSFFDPQQKTYRTLHQRPIPLAVKASTAGQPQPTIVGGAPPNQPLAASGQDITHIKPYLGQLSGPQLELLRQPWFLVLQSVPMLAWLAALTWRKHREALANNPRRKRRLEVAKNVRRGLQELAVLAGQGKAEEFFATIFRVLQEQLGERLDLPASAITEAVLDERLRPLGVSEDLLGRLHELFQACNQARYARHIGSEQLNWLVPKLESALGELQNLESLNGK